MKTPASYLMAMSVSGYFKQNDWKMWAKDRISSDDNVKQWVYNVAMAKNLDELMKILQPIVNEEDYYRNNSNQYSDGIMGYYYLRYLNNEFTIEDLLYLSVEEANEGDSLVPSERFTDLLEAVERNLDITDDDKFNDEINDFFGNFKTVAENQLILLKQ